MSSRPLLMTLALLAGSALARPAQANQPQPDAAQPTLAPETREPQPRLVVPPSTEARARWEELNSGKKTAGRINFWPQPTEDELRAFAAAGGKTVINARTDKEIERLSFDERALVESLGMQYVHIPTSSRTFGYDTADAFADAYISSPGQIMYHCASGSRSATTYGLYLHVYGGIEKEAAIARALELGMVPSSATLIERTLMQTPMRIMGAVDEQRIREYIDTLVGFGTRHTLSETKSQTRGIGAARQWVLEQFERNIDGHGKTGQATPKVYFDGHTVEPDGRRITEQVRVVNVVCEIPGSMPEARKRLYYVLAHLDSRASEANDATSDAPGANDDASGVAAMLELARVLAKEQLDATVVLMATSGEEQGLFGARLHAQAAHDQGLNIQGVLNNDTVGDPTGVLEDQDGSKEIRIFSEGLPATLLSLEDAELGAAVRRLRLYGTESDSISRQLARFIAYVGDFQKTAIKPRLVFRPDRFLRGGDHTPFNELGYAAVRFCETYENYDHQHQDVRTENGVQYGDLAEYVDENYLADVTRLNAAVLAHLANAPSTPRNARVLIAQLTNDTTLRWDPVPEPDVAGYELVWRETSAPDWEHSQDVGDVTEATLPLSKDNWFFGVRSYDHEGYRSPVAYPLPARE